MKAIMISVKPKYCALEMNGEKIIEVRKNESLARAIQKLYDEYGYADIYVYCSKGKYEMGKFNSDKKYHEIRDDCSYAGGSLRGLPDETVNGKVVFKFRCYKVEEMRPFFHWCIEKETCLTRDEVLDYLDSKDRSVSNPKRQDKVYAIHISNLEIFDRPKELSEFRHYKRFDCYNADFDYRTVEYRKIELTKAPQNFCYVEVE